jgi:hypothetical protein
VIFYGWGWGELQMMNVISYYSMIIIGCCLHLAEIGMIVPLGAGRMAGDMG